MFIGSCPTRRSSSYRRRQVMCRLKERLTRTVGDARLEKKRFPERVVRPNEELVAAMETGEVADVGQMCELSCSSAVAGAACEHEVPRRVQIERQTS